MASIGSTSPLISLLIRASSLTLLMLLGRIVGAIAWRIDFVLPVFIPRRAEMMSSIAWRSKRFSQYSGASCSYCSLVNSPPLFSSILARMALNVSSCCSLSFIDIFNSIIA